ncbi:MAG: DUF5714 domain-containing protein [Candidatus Scatomorpha sp.]
MKKAEERILEYCAERALGDAAAPEDIACALMNEPGVLRMHGPEHHFLTAASLCAAWCAERRDDARPRLERLRVRCAQIPAGVCGYYGVCGDTLAAGAFLSEILGATYLSGTEWQVVNNFTARVQSGVAASCTRGPRCCKRTTLAAISSAVSALSELTGAALPRPERIKCTFRAMNSQCIGKDCIFCDGIPG